jgi:hypothetical protein
MVSKAEHDRFYEAHEKTDFTCFDEHGNNHRVIWNSSMLISV